MNEIINILSHKSGTPMKKGSVRILALWAKRIGLLIIGLFVIGFATWGQVTGDYRTRQNGTWNDRTDWERWDGTSWQIPTAGQGYPGQNAGTLTVTIVDNISLNVNPANAIGGLNIQANLTPDNNNRTLNITGDFSISAGTLSLSANNGRVTTFNIGGDFSMSGGTITESANANGAINFNGTGVQSFTKTAGTISNTINFTVNSGSILDMGTSVLNGSTGTFTLSSGAGIITKHAQGISTTAGTGCIQVTGAKTFDTNADYTYNSSTGNQVTGNGLPATVRNLTIDNTANGLVSLTNSIVVNNVLTINSGILTFGTTPAKTLTVNGAFSFASGAINMTGNAGVNHSLVLNGTTSCAPIGGFTKGTGSVTYGGAAAQSILVLDYYNLTKSGAGNATLCGNINIEGDLTISAGTVSAGVYSINLGGDFINNSSFNAGTGTVLFNGSLLQTLGGSSNTTFNNLTVNNSNGVDLGASISVNGLLTLTNGNLRLVNNSLTITNPIAGGAFSNTRMIVTNGTGSLIKQGTTNAAFQMVYPIGTGTAYTPVEIASLSSSSITGTGTFAIRSVATAASGIPGNNPLDRHWITSSTNINSPVADIRFTYVNGDVHAPATASEYDFMYNPGSWTVPVGSGSTGSNPLTSSAATNLNATWSATVYDKYTVPPGITSIKVECWGAGGGGSTIINDAGLRGGGGGGGAYAKSILSVIPGNTYYFIKGIGGAGNSSGGSSSFGSSLVVAAGGNGGTFNNASGGTGGSVAASTGTVRNAGGNGANGGGTSSGGGGGGAGTTGAGGNATGATAGTGTSQNGGNGGTGVNNSANGQNGVNFGGGGSGASTNSATDRTGGNGANGQVLISLPSQITLTSNTQITSANVYQGTVKLPVFSFETAVVTSETNLTAINFNTSGTYLASDITRFQLWYNTTNNLGTATQVGLDISTSLGTGAHTLSGFSRLTAIGTTGYFWVTADVVNTATPNATLSVDAIAPSNLTYELATVTGTTTVGGAQTIVAVPRVALSSLNPAVPTANVDQGTKNHVIYRFTTAITWADATLNSVTLTTAGSYTATDVLNFKLWYNTSNDITTASQVGSTIISSLGTGSHTFSGFNLTTPNGSTGYFWITTDIAPFPNNGRTINVNAVNTGNLVYSSIVFASSTANAGNNQTIVTQNGVFISSTYPAVSANSLLQGSVKQNVYKFTTIVSGAAATINSVSFTTTGTYVATDVVNFKLYYSTSNSMVGATLLSTLASGLNPGLHTFTGLSQSTNSSTTAYFWITADIASSAVPAHTLTVDPITTGNLTYSGSPNKFGTTSAGGIQTIQLKIDSDNDGVADLYDLDDDNDGTPDYDENLACNTAVAELFPNSNFDAGNTGFSSGYGYVTIVDQNSLHPEGIYAITPNANLGHGAFANCTGHGNMMVVNGSSNLNLIVWSSGNIPVTPNTDYTLTINLTSVNPTSPAQLIFNVNGENIGLQFNATINNCEWVPGIAVWNSGNNTSATFDILNLNSDPSGNDFAIDDISCKYKVNCDYDGDGVPDKLDIDSDNDGIYDVAEAGGTATATGTINGFTDVDLDGLSDNVDNRSSGTGSPDIFNGTPLANPDTDSDLIPDRCDTDSDNDFCPDTKEAGLPDADGDGRLGSSPLTVDARGKVTSAVGYTGTIDTNGDGTKDYVQKIPYITTQPTNKTLCLPSAGTTFSLTATNTGGTYQWQVSTDNGVTWTNITNGGVYSGATGADAGTLTISNAVTAAYDGYLYRILLTNIAYNCSPLASSAGLLRVYSGAPPAPGLISGNATVCSSVSQIYSVTSIPSATSYTWSVPGGWSITSGNGTNSITANTGVAGGSISVTASNFCGTSGASTLAVAISAPTPTFTVPAAGTTICQSADITYTTQAGKSNYIWTIGGSLGIDYIITSGGSSSDNSVTLKWLTTLNKNVKVNYTSGGCAGLTAASVDVTVDPNAMVITQPVAPTPACAGTGSIPLSITATGATGYQWQVSTDGGSSWTNLTNSGFYSNVTTASMTISNPLVSFNNYQYRCEITGACGAATSFAVTLTVNSSAISSQSTATQTQCIGGTFTPISVTTTGSGLTYQWYSNTTATTTGSTSLGSANGAQTNSYTPQASTAGTLYYYCIVSGTCGSVTSAFSGAFIVTALPTASISYSGSPWCTSAGVQSVTLVGTAGGAYSSTAGLTINAATGAITPSSSTDGTYTVTYTIAAAGGCGIVTATTSVTITALPTATISYAGTPFCKTLGAGQAVSLVGTAGGTYSSTAGLTIVGATGAINPSTSTAGPYTITYTIAAAGGCAVVTATTPITITALPVATFSYAGTPYCSNAANPSPTLTGSAGVFSSTAGLNFVSNATGQVNLATSTAGAYTVTNTIAAANGCALVSATSPITINPIPTVNAGGAMTAICQGETSASLNGSFGGGATSAVWSDGGAGGIFTNNGGATPNTSTYTSGIASGSPVTLTLTTVGGSCGTTSANKTITVNPLPTTGPLFRKPNN